jgi:choline-sulfatase
MFSFLNKFIGAAFWALALLGCSTTAAERPNVLFIAIDDMNDWVGCLSGHPDTRTPNLDRLAKRGVLFTNAHCQAPICNPSRTSVMYGVRPSTTGIYLNAPIPWNVPAMQERVTLARHFSANGYRTFATGKIYHGSGLPKDDFQIEGPRHSQLNRELDVRLQKEMSGLWDFGPQSYPEDQFIDHIDASWVIEKLGEAQDKPFFMAIGFYRPHVPFYSPERVFNSFDPKKLRLPKVKEGDLADLPSEGVAMARAGSPNLEWFIERNLWREAVQSYLACIRWTDEQVGRLLDGLDASPFGKNTIIVLYSDHGFHLGEKQRFRKQSLWERSTHVPLIISVPGMSKGKRCQRPVELLSLYPTLIELCGLTKRDDLDGTSIVPLLKDPTTKWNRPAITTLGKNNHAIRTEQWRYIRYADGGEELYDRKQDPQEWHNLANQANQAEVKRGLMKWFPKENVDTARSRTGEKKKKKGRRNR